MNLLASLLVSSQPVASPAGLPGAATGRPAPGPKPGDSTDPFQEILAAALALVSLPNIQQPQPSPKGTQQRPTSAPSILSASAGISLPLAALPVQATQTSLAMSPEIAALQSAVPAQPPQAPALSAPAQAA